MGKEKKEGIEDTSLDSTRQNPFQEEFAFSFDGSEKRKGGHFGEH